MLKRTLFLFLLFLAPSVSFASFTQTPSNPIVTPFSSAGATCTLGDQIAIWDTGGVSLFQYDSCGGSSMGFGTGQIGSFPTIEWDTTIGGGAVQTVCSGMDYATCSLELGVMSIGVYIVVDSGFTIQNAGGVALTTIGDFGTNLLIFLTALVGFMIAYFLFRWAWRKIKGTLK